MTFGYDADVTKLDSSQVTNGTTESHSADLCVTLARERAETDSVERPIILVAHSLGGLVCAQALIAGDRADLDYDIAAVSRHIRGMVFLGTPFRGSSLATWGEMLRKIAHTFHETQSEKLKDLDTRSEKLKILAESFPEVISKRRSEGSKIGVIFCYETLKTRVGMFTTDLVVKEDAAWIPGAGDHVKIHANHTEMCKFCEKGDEGYKTIVGAIKKFGDLKKSEDRSDHGGAIFHNYGQVHGQIGRDQNITGTGASGMRWG